MSELRYEDGSRETIQSPGLAEISHCPVCGTRLLAALKGVGWFMCDDCGAYLDDADEGDVMDQHDNGKAK
jgi:hypothetical protein